MPVRLLGGKAFSVQVGKIISILTQQNSGNIKSGRVVCSDMDSYTSKQVKKVRFRENKFSFKKSSFYKQA